MMAQVSGTAQRMRAAEQLRCADRKEGVPQQERRLEPRPTAAAVADAEIVALHRANLPELVIAYCACFRIGATACPFNIRLKTAELQPSCGAASYIGNDRAAEICCPRCPVQKTVAATTASPVAPS
jgi:acyl-CoA synthetase (AMP-forming)/AMP-acid ligase II